MITKETIRCYHCHSPQQESMIRHDDKDFCCQGCITVYDILHSRDLCQFYDMDDMDFLKKAPFNISRSYSYLDTEEFSKRLIRYSDQKQTHVRFYIPQIHCRSCLWLLERLYKIDSRILRSEVLFDQKELYVVYETGSLLLSELVSILASIGYEPSINQTAEDEKPKTQRSEILKIGISGFCFANIMMLSLPEYFSSGIIQESIIRSTIPVLQILLSLPVITYTAWDFFRPSISNLKKGRLIIDFPISVAIVITFLRSIYDIYYGYSAGYLDSMTGIVFFMLIGRWMQSRTHQFLSFDRKFLSFFPVMVEKIEDMKRCFVSINDIQKGDRITIYPQEIIPVDGILSRGKAVIDYSFVNGESDLQEISIGQHIYAGGKQTQNTIDLIVMNSHEQSKMISMWNHASFKNKKVRNENQLLDTAGMIFTWIVLGLGMGAWLFWMSQSKPLMAWNSLTTILIVACPCALLLTSSFVYGHYIRVLSKYHFFLRDSQVLNDLINIDHIVFDKTGTLTIINGLLVEFQGDQLDEKTKQALTDIFSHSQHKLARAILEYLAMPVDHYDINMKETIGEGLEVWLDDQHYKIGSDRFVGLQSEDTRTRVHVIRDNRSLGCFIIQNKYRSGIEKMIGTLGEKFKLSLLSGDHENEYTYLSKFFPLNASLKFRQTPLQKLEYIEQTKSEKNERIMMVGDGLNDSGAFKAADVGVVITERNNNFNPESDIILEASSLIWLDKLLTFVSKMPYIVMVISVYSLLYNLIGLYFALQGKLSPVVAAILMPMSSISIILGVYLSVEYFHYKIFKNTQS